MSKNQFKTVNEDTSIEVVSWHNMKIKDVYKKLKTDDKGLSENEVMQRLQVYGPNKITIVLP